MRRIISDLSSWASLTLLVQKRLEKSKKPFVVTLGAAPKNWVQLAYLHSEVLPKLTVALFDAGEIRKNSEREAKYYLKVKLGFGQWIDWNGSQVFDPDSFSDASIEVLTSAIDTAIYECEQRGVFVAPPKEKR